MKNFKNFKKDYIKEYLSDNNFEIINIYDAENIKGIVDSFKLNNVLPLFLYEGIDFELDKPGGMILFSTDLNSTLGTAETILDKIKFFFESKWKTTLNRLNVTNRIRKILLDKYGMPGYTVGKNFKGQYTSKNGMIFSEKSFTIDIAGVESDVLVLIASEICREFKQETVMVRDFNDNKVYFVNDKS